MNTFHSMICVARSVGRQTEWVRASGRHDLVHGEPTLRGEFTIFTVRTGPSGSHNVTCFQPSVRTTCGVLNASNPNSVTSEDADAADIADPAATAGIAAISETAGRFADGGFRASA